jgi:hypothetical protein
MSVYSKEQQYYIVHHEKIGTNLGISNEGLEHRRMVFYQEISVSLSASHTQSVPTAI